MARSHLTLAALATAAVPELVVSSARPIGSGVHGDFESALLTCADGRSLVIRVPRSERAEAEQSADLIALRTLSTGIRARLPFTVSTFVGQAPTRGTRAVVYEYVYGHPLRLHDIREGDLAVSIGRAIAAIHALPTSFLADAGLPVLSAGEILRQTAGVIDRAAESGLVPAALLERWGEAVEDSALWQFAPTAINGALSADALLSDSQSVTGILGWHGFSVGDPARDLFWLIPHEVAAEAVFAAYQEARGTHDRQLRRRATLYSELELAKWLLHGIQSRSTEVVDDAVRMLHGLVDAVQDDLERTLTHQSMPVLGVDEVEALLDESEARRGA